MQPTYTTRDLVAGFTYPMRNRVEPLVDYERGGVAIGDASLGVDYQGWVSSYDGANIRVGPHDGESTPIIAVPGVVRTALAFDLLMRTHLGYTVGTSSFLYWFDSVAGQMATMEFPGVTDICMTLDERRSVYSGQADIVVSYSRARRIYTRIQRERFQTEHLLQDADMGGDKLYRFGMTNINRLAWVPSPT